jgi:hypothetical protein
VHGQVWEREGAGQAVLLLSVEASWRIPQRCAMDKLTVAHHIGVRHAYPGILQKHARCSVDNNMHIAHWFCWLFDTGRCQVRTLDLPLFFVFTKTIFQKVQKYYIAINKICLF